MLLIAGGIYAVLASVTIHRGIDHSQVLILLLQHLLLLPALWHFLKRSQLKGAAPSSISPAFAAAAVSIYCVLAFALGHYWDRGFTVADEAVYVFQSKIYRSGHWYAEAPPSTSPDAVQSYKDRFFEFTLIKDGRWFTQYPPGWPALLAAGNLARLPRWWINPLLGLLLLWLAYRIAAEMYDAATASLTLVFLVASPFFLSYCIGLMSHVSCAVFIGLAMWCYVRADRSSGLNFYVGMLAALCIACLIRPATGLATGVVLGLASLWRFRAQPSQCIRLAVFIAGFGVALLAAIMAQNSMLTGDPWMTPYQMHAAVAGVDGFPDLNFGQAMLKMSVAVRWSLQQMLLHNPPFLFLLAGLAVWRERGKNAILACLFIALILAHAASRMDPRSLLGERFYFESLMGIAILAARTASLSLLRIPRGAALSLLIVFAGVQAVHFSLFLPPLLDSVRNKRDIVQRIETLPLDKAVVYFEDGYNFTAKHYNLNEPDWKHQKLFYLPDPGPDRREELTCHFRRQQWVVVTNTKAAGLGVERSRMASCVPIGDLP